MLKEQRFLLVLSVALFLVATQWIIFGVARESWFDMSFTLETVHKMRVDGFSSIDWKHYDVHPPLAYFPFYVWSFLQPAGMSEYHWAQELPVLWGLIFIVFVFLSLSKAFGFSGQLATVGLSACTTYLHYGTEVRQYMALMALSAIIFFCVLHDLERWYGIVAALLVMVLPLMHYFAAMAVFFYCMMGIIYAKRRGKWNGDVAKGYGFFVFLGILGIAIAGFGYALPQRAHVVGTWFQPPSPADWPSAVFYTFFMTDMFKPDLLLFILYLGLLVFMGFCAWVAYRVVNNEFSSPSRVLLFLMGMSILLSLIGIVAAPLLGGNGFAHLYHHRFFLVVDWLFAAMAFVLLAELILRMWDKKRRLVAMAIVVGTVWIMIAMILIYGQNAHHELQHLMEKTPCSSERIQIGHESPFSALPYQVYAREHGCNWFNFVSTNQTPRMLAGGGGDIMPNGSLFFNKTLPDGNYFVVYAEGMVPIDGIYTKVALEDGVELWYVTRLSNVVHVEK